MCATPLRVDAYIISRSTKTCIVGPELTAPMEENIEHWHKIKQEKYKMDFNDAKDWKVSTLVLEVGSRGWIPPPFFGCLRKLNFTNSEIKVLAKNCSYMAQKCSYIIFLNKDNKLFHPYRLTPTFPLPHDPPSSKEKEQKKEDSVL